MASIDNFYAIYLILNFILYEKEEIIMVRQFGAVDLVR